MAGQIYTRSKLQGLQAVVESMFADLKLAGMTQIMPASGQGFTPTAGKGKFVLESAPAINPLHATQPYRILVDLDTTTSKPGEGRIRIAVANPSQIDNTGNTSTFPGAVDTTGARIMGQLGAAWNATTPKKGDAFVSRNLQNSSYDNGTTASYLLVATPRGITFFLWEDASDSTPAFSWFSIQSPVDKDSGSALVTDNSPIFCVYSADALTPQKFVVSESDVFRPTPSSSAAADSLNSAAILNAEEQVAIAKGNKYLVTFPNRLNTDRYAYTEELDMIAYTSADVIAEESEIPVTVYGEGTPRVYRAMKANGPNNTKMRLLVLVEGGGVPAAV